MTEKKFKGWPSWPKGGPLEKKFFKHVFMIRKLIFWWNKGFFHIFKAFEAYQKISNLTKKNLEGDLITKGGTIGKKNFSKCFWFENDSFDERKHFFIFSKHFKHIKRIRNWSKKNLRGDHQDQRGDHWKKIFQRCFYHFKMIVLMKENVFSYIFKAIWSIVWIIFKTGRKKM